MKTVYAVTLIDYNKEPYTVFGIFDSQEQAEIVVKSIDSVYLSIDSYDMFDSAQEALDAQKNDNIKRKLPSTTSTNVDSFIKDPVDKEEK